jgi:archaellum component FlaF (FlaF/FlaG flagellin family)
MYYNETVLSDTESTITGLLYIDGIMYNIQGEFNLDDEEQEIELVATLPNDEDTYVVISQEIESDEESFEIEWVNNGETTLETSFEIEFDEEDITIEISYESETFEITYVIEKVSPSRIQIEYEMENLENDEEGFILLEIFTNDNGRLFRFTIQLEDAPAVIVEKQETTVTTNAL